MWANRLIFSHHTYMGTLSDIRSRKKDDIFRTLNSLCHFYQLQGHITIIFYVLFGFSISERTDVAFFWYEYLRL
jgi:hypothetical protein